MISDWDYNTPIHPLQLELFPEKTLNWHLIHDFNWQKALSRKRLERDYWFFQKYQIGMVDRFSSGPNGRHGGLPLRRHGGCHYTGTGACYYEETGIWQIQPFCEAKIQASCGCLFQIRESKPVAACLWPSLEDLWKKDKWQTCTEHFINRIGHF